MSKTTIEVEISTLDENVKKHVQYWIDTLRRELSKLDGVSHAVTYPAPAVVVDPSPVQTKGEHTSSATPTNTKPK